ncbi:MAG: hypothetical protein ACOCUI_02735 [bacterium]
MSNMNLKKYSIYEFDFCYGKNNKKTSKALYKKDEENPSESIIEVIDEKENKIIIPVEMFISLHEALNIIDPYGFVFSDIGLDDDVDVDDHDEDED